MSKIRIKGDTSGHVDLETSATGSNLSISGNTTIGGDTTTDNLTLGSTSTSQPIIQMLSNTSGANTIHFGDAASGADSYKGYINYAHNIDQMQFAVNGSVRQTINSSGLVTMPLQPSFMVRANTGSQSIPSGVGVASGFHNATVMHNVGNCLNSANAIFTAPVDGRYYIEVSIYSQTTSGSKNQYVASFLNFSNAGPVYGFMECGPDVQAQISGIFNMSANDTVQPYTYGHPSLTQTYLGQHSYFSGHLLG